jgi:hypothetical protein
VPEGWLRGMTQWKEKSRAQGYVDKNCREGCHKLDGWGGFVLCGPASERKYAIIFFYLL